MNAGKFQSARLLGSLRPTGRRPVTLARAQRYMPPSSGLEATKDKLVPCFVDETDGASFVIRVRVSESSV